MKVCFILLCTLAYCATLLDGYRILGIFPYNGKSHNVMFSALMKGLAKRGHQVDDITHFPVKDAGKTYNVVVNLNGTLKSVVNSFTIDYVKLLDHDVARMIADDYGNAFCKLMDLPEMQKLIKNPPNNPPYDVVITEAFGSHCFMGFGHLLNVPVIAVSSSVEYPWVSQLIGSDDNPAYVCNALSSDFDKSSFFDRLWNTVSYHQTVHTFHKTSEKFQTDAMRKYLKTDTPNIRQVERSVALTLVNRHPVLYGAKPIAPSLVEVSGLHIEQSELRILTPKWKKYLDESSDGVAYFTFGSLVLIESLPEKTILDVYKSFAKITPIRVIMKIADKRKLPPGLPKNVYTSAWIPQQAVLSHPNVKVFITHGGLMGIQETLYFAVPIIGIPLFGDQHRNVAIFVEKNMGVKINFDNITTESLDEALNEVLKNPKYKKNAKIYSNLFKDRPMNATDTASFWIEYIIRNGPNVLRSPALELEWWQLHLLDVYGFILASIVLTTILLYCILKYSLDKLLYGTSEKHKKE
ncbi:UDP-glycosyltransferase UGT5-like isoform X1 [Phymastichus coffea]|uniref:UDP-glycosyltransferase UGT5-like isoform X1 n=1 Tax=Phymastichus coffea TaxID=108790 RepID=UPI00273C4699|nr:UDP-glycosyltransferase UGT5-like isoform X1 [Phymastichus coffea]XP_058804714.1 UDP-glycosyltransferase UGT5-like isoform X1 [Phymastichus coffea]